MIASRRSARIRRLTRAGRRGTTAGDGKPLRASHTVLKIFLDHCVPKRLLRLLAEHEVKTAYQMGWAAKKNGELLKLVASEFEVFLTVDQNLRHQQNLASSSLKFIVLVVHHDERDG